LVEARALGASAVLLIARALAPSELKTLGRVAIDLGLEAMVEVRDLAELDRALGIDARIIGVNNRDLETLRIDPTTAERLIPAIPADRIAIAESGMRTVADVSAAALWGADAVLIGSWLSASADPAASVRSLTSIPTTKRDA
jgi:indole-3-glycerol phosphate synthase